jgi:DUF4097 and DUF4098 domain-containing protein YvlB
LLERLSDMSTNTASGNEHQTRRSRVLVWALAIVALVLFSLAAGLRAQAKEWNAKASRTETFNASGDLKSLAVETVNGRVEIVAGTTFRADVEVTAWGATDSEAKKNLGEIKVRFENENGALSLFTEEPGVRVRRSGHGWDVRGRGEDRRRSETKYRVTVPAGMAVNVSAVNGGVSMTGVSAPVDLTTVNGKITLEGGRGDAKLNTVNGAIAASFTDLPKGANLDLRTVNGGIALTLPAKAGFRFEGHTMSGEILSSFAFPVAATPEAVREGEETKAVREKIRAEQRKIRDEIRKKEKEKAKEKGASRKDGDEDVVIDLSELNEALADLNREMADLDREMADMGREISRSITVNLNRSYEGTVGDGGAFVSVSNLNGRILVLAEGTSEAQAKRLTSPRATRVVTIPPIPSLPRIIVREHPAAAPVAPVPAAPSVAGIAPAAPIPPDPWGRSIVVGDVEGDYAPAIASGDITVGKVSGHATITSRSGQIRLQEAGKGAELSTAGGDIRAEAVTGSFKATTFGGDIRVGSVTGDARLETSGGDVVVRAASGAVTARTGGGDIVVKKVRGPVTARTSGGSITCEITGTGGPGGDLSTSGGDVTVTLPANYKADVDIHVTGTDLDSDAIVSQFPEVAVSRRSGHLTGEGRLNGGGPRLVIRSTGGVVTIKKGPTA